MRDDYHIILKDVSRRATGNSRHEGRRLFLSPDLLMTLYPSTFGHYEIALTVLAGEFKTRIILVMDSKGLT